MFELNGVKYEFKRVNVETAIEIQTLISKDGDVSGESQKRLILIAVDHLVAYVKDENRNDIRMEGRDLETYAHIFDNPFFTLEIVEKFGEVIKGFLEKLPSFTKEGKKQNRVMGK